MKEIIKSLADSVSGIEIEKKLFSTRVSIYGNELKHYTLYFGADASARINDYISKNDAQLLEKLVPVNYGPNMIEVFKALDNSISVFRIFQERIDRLEGVLMLMLFGAYYTYLFIKL